MPSQGHNYSPFPPPMPTMTASTVSDTVSASAASGSGSIANLGNSSMTHQGQYHPYYPSLTQYQSQVYSQPYQQYPFQGYQYYHQPVASTNYAQAYIDATYSATFQQMPQVAPPTNSQNLNYQRSNNNSWKKPQRLPVAYCNDCSRPFYTNMDYQNHLKSHVECPDCGLILTKKQLVSHRNEAHPKLVTLDNSEDVANYIAERKGKYPKSGNDKAGDTSKNLLCKDPNTEKEQNATKKRKVVVSVGYCKFFPLGKCKKGAGCPYYHEIPNEQDEAKAALQSPDNLEKKKKPKKQRKKTMNTSKMKIADRSKLFQLLNEEFMTKDDSTLLQVIRYVMDNSKSSLD